MRELFDFGFNDLNRDGKIDAGERAFGFSVLNDMMRGNGKGDDDDDDDDDDFDSNDNIWGDDREF